METKIVTLYCHPGIRQAIKHQAVDENISVSELINRLLIEYLTAKGHKFDYVLTAGVPL